MKWKDFWIAFVFFLVPAKLKQIELQLTILLK